MNFSLTPGMVFTLYLIYIIAALVCVSHGVFHISSRLSEDKRRKAIAREYGGGLHTKDFLSWYELLKLVCAYVLLALVPLVNVISLCILVSYWCVYTLPIILKKHLDKPVIKP